MAKTKTINTGIRNQKLFCYNCGGEHAIAYPIGLKEMTDTMKAFVKRHGENPFSFIDLAKRQLMINKITYPASTMSRAFRYYKKGYSMCIGEMKKLVESIQDMPKEVPQESDTTQEQTSGDAMTFFMGID